MNVATETRPLAVRVLRLAGWAAFGVGLIAVGIGALLRFDEPATIWIVIAAILLLIAATALLGARRWRAGPVFGLIACALMLLLLPVGTLVTIAIALIASQTWSQLRDYYGLRRRTA